MQLREGVKVYTWDNQDVGSIKRVVLNPVTKEVTHVVIRQGFLFTEDKVVPIDYFSSGNEERATLNRTAENLEDLPPFEEEHFVSSHYDEYGIPAYSDDAVDPLYWYPPAGMMPYYGAGVYPPDHGQIVRKEQNIPDDTVAVKDGARVISTDGEHVGNVERVFMNAQSDYATHILISQGLFFKTRKLVPTMWLSHITEDEVHLSLDSEFVDALPAYEDEPQSTR